MSVDIEITKTRADGSIGKYFDMNVVNGDLQNERNFDSSLKVSLFSDKRADSSEVLSPEYRRGWWGNETARRAGFEIGSKLWLLKQNRLTTDLINKANDYARSALEWLVNDGHADDFTVNTIVFNEGIRITVVLIVNGSPVEGRYFDLWQNTGNID